MNTILVTGGAGFIGGTFVRRCLKHSRYRIVNFDKLTYAAIDNSMANLAAKDYEFIRGDIGDFECVRQLLARTRPQAIVNFAAESHVDRSIDEPAEFIKTNVVGTCQLLKAACDYWQSLSGGERSGFRFLHVGTDEVYGSLGPTGKLSEETRYAPRSPYAASKASSNHFVDAWHHTYGLPTLITNSSNNYGPYQFPEKLIPLMTLNAIEGKPLPVYGDGKNVRDWVFVDDHCEAIELILGQGRIGETYNIGANCERTNLEIVQAICRTVGDLAPEKSRRCEDLIRFVDDRPGHDYRYAIDASKIQNELGWKLSTSFDEGIRTTVGWYIDNAEWINRVTSGAYSRQRLGLRVK